MSHIIASNLCYTGTTNPKIREAIQAILAADFEGATRILADAFIDTQEALEREQVAAQLTIQEDQEHITLLRGQLEEAQDEAQHLRDELEEQEARADHFEEIYEEYKGDALAARRMQERAQTFEARIKELEEELRESQALAASIDAERIQALKELHYEEGCGEMRISYIQQLHEEIQDLQEQLEEAQEEAAKGRRSAFSTAPLRSAVWGGGVVPVYEDEDAATPPAAAAAAPPAAPKKPKAPSLIDLSNEDDDILFYPPLSFNAAGCIEGCEICEGNKGMKDEIDRSELEDDLEMVALYADGSLYQPEKPLEAGY